MDWLVWMVLALALLMWFAFKQAGQISVEAARAHLRAGAVLLDVRSAAEFAGGHLPRALNLPHGDVASRIGNVVPDRNTIILLHCLSGGRSAIACAHLKQLGYRGVFNLGSYARAQSILEGLS